MSVEDDLEAYAGRAVELTNEIERMTHHESKERIQGLRSVLLMDAEGLIARNPRALKAKAMIVWNEDWVRNPTSAEASFVRSLLRDLLQWEP